MGAGFAKYAEQDEIHTQGGAAAGGTPESQGFDPNMRKPQPPPPPPVPKFQPPAMYAPRQSELQSASVNRNSTSHQYLQRFGVATRF